ncbi:hypothetical protein BD779DRAFT_1477086 [Infundibulicybe gibba]|nr:hypothetical protein BD779DRAFT_1477086 [Infundibulicybe gibba]
MAQRGHERLAFHSARSGTVTNARWVAPRCRRLAWRLAGVAREGGWVRQAGVSVSASERRYWQEGARAYDSARGLPIMLEAGWKSSSSSALSAVVREREQRDGRGAAQARSGGTDERTGASEKGDKLESREGWFALLRTRLEWRAAALRVRPLPGKDSGARWRHWKRVVAVATALLPPPRPSRPRYAQRSLLHPRSQLTGVLQHVTPRFHLPAPWRISSTAKALKSPPPNTYPTPSSTPSPPTTSHAPSAATPSH